MTLIPPELTVTVDNVGLVANTAAPEPVSSVSAVARLEELKEPNDVVVLLDVIAPVKFGILVVEVAVPVSAPVKLPLKVVAVTTPATITLPRTSKEDLGAVELIPTRSLAESKYNIPSS